MRKTSYQEHVQKHGVKNTTLERINVNKGYTVDNCTWTTWYEQANNKTSNLNLTAISPEGIEYSVHNLKRFCEEHSIYYQSAIALIAHHRKINNPISHMRNGWSFIEV